MGEVVPRAAVRPATVDDWGPPHFHAIYAQYEAGVSIAEPRPRCGRARAKPPRPGVYSIQPSSRMAHGAFHTLTIFSTLSSAFMVRT